MFSGIGTDIIEIKRIKKSIERHGKHFLNKVFTLKEQKYCHRYKDPTPHFAARFAAKEAVVKALGVGFRNGITWLDIEIINNSNGQPIAYLSDRMSEQFRSPELLLSMSHCREYAIATAVKISS